MSSSIFLNVPNVIGYIRAASFTIGIWHALHDSYHIAALMYAISYGLDFIDGPVARALNQCTKFGHFFDQSLDKVSDLLWRFVLCQIYPDYTYLIALYAGFAVMSQWIFTHSFAMRGEGTHKIGKGNLILKFYYSEPWFDIIVCGDWCMWLMLYLLKYTTGPTVPVVDAGLWTCLFILSSPLGIYVGVAAVAKFIVAARYLASLDYKKE